jgi:uncharacterized membrane protein YeaQ/YmgE (transglycosylase-associated protein family)
MNFLNDVLSAPFICVGWIIVGAVAGALARASAVEGRTFFSDLLLGIAGAMVRSFLAGFVGFPSTKDRGLTLVLTSLVLATVGAALPSAAIIVRD